jgi:hypothetical protein
MQKRFPKRTMLPVKQHKSGQVHRARETTTEDFYLPMVDPDFHIIERDADKLHAFARGLLNRLRKPSRSYSFEMVKAATVWLVGAYVDAQVPVCSYLWLAGLEWQFLAGGNALLRHR